VFFIETPRIKVNSPCR